MPGRTPIGNQPGRHYGEPGSEPPGYRPGDYNPSPLTPQTPPTRDPLPMSAPSPVQMGPSPWLRRSPQHPMTGWMAHGDRYQHQAPSAQTPPIVQPPTTETPPIYDPKSMTPKMSR